MRSYGGCGLESAGVVYVTRPDLMFRLMNLLHEPTESHLK